MCTHCLLTCIEACIFIFLCAVLLPVDGPTIPDVKELLKPTEITKAEMKAVEMK